MSSALSKEEPINFNPIDIYEWKQLCMELGLHFEQATLGVNNNGEFSDGPSLQIIIVKGDGNSFFGSIS